MTVKSNLEHRMYLSLKRARQFPLQLCVAAALCCLLITPQAQVVSAPTTGSPSTAKATSTRPRWQDLTPSQQHALTPLAQLWPDMNEPHKRKWLAISQNFAQLSADEKAVVQGRMREWAALSPQQRALARLNFADAKQLPQDEKRSKWEAYQALSPEAKQKLATQQPSASVSAAIAVKPVASSKLATPPAASTNKTLPRIATDQAAPTTLLPARPNTAAANVPSSSNAPAESTSTTP